MKRFTIHDRYNTNWSVIAEGCLFDDNRVAVAWLVPYPAMVFFLTLEEMIKYEVETVGRKIEWEDL